MEELKNSINFVGRGKADPNSSNNFENRGITTVKRTSMAKPPYRCKNCWINHSRPYVGF